MLRIFSKFQDYYDYAIGSFVESDIVIHRDTKTHDIQTKDIVPLGDFDAKWDYIFENKHGKCHGHYPVAMIGFCGKWYFFKYKNTVESNYKELDPSSIEYKTMDEIIENNGNKSLFGWKQSANYKNPDNEKFWNFDLFEKYGPVLYIKDYGTCSKYRYYPWINPTIKIVRWPNLKELKFQTVMDPYTALWELEHWFDCHARPDEAVVPVGDDITRLEAYGFDKKTSFRKGKEK